jgi:hypothetical protein
MVNVTIMNIEIGFRYKFKILISLSSHYHFEDNCLDCQWAVQFFKAGEKKP